MDIHLIITLGIILITMVLLGTELLRVDLVAIIVMVLWVVTGILSPEESFAGFSNAATLTVAAMFILSDALIRAGVIQLIAPYTTKLFNRSFGPAVFGMSLGIGSISAFINNTPVVATFIPIVSRSAKKLNLNPTKFLIPLSYGAILGGCCTLIGTSTNLLVAGIASNNGLTDIGIFTMTPIGLIFFFVGTLYLVFISNYLLPKNAKKGPLEDDKEIKVFLTEVKLSKLKEEESGTTIESLFNEKDLNVKVVQLKRSEEIFKNPTLDTKLYKDDVLVISGAMDKVKKVILDHDLSIVNKMDEKSFPEVETKMVEVIVMPGTQLVDKKLKNINFLKKYQSRLLAIRQGGKRKFKNLDDTRLKVGDVLLLQTNEEGHELIQNTEKYPDAPFLSIRESSILKKRKKEILKVSSIIIGVILLATLNILPIVASAWLGVALLVLMNALNMSDVYRAIDWKVIFLLAGSLSFGGAMKASGLSDLLAQHLSYFLQSEIAPNIVIAALYLITVLFTEIMSNNAAAALLTPIAIAVASSLSVNVTPLLITVMMAGSASFITPIGYQTNTMVYSAGNYLFSDFFKVGAPLSLILWIIASIFIPILYPLY